MLKGLNHLTLAVSDIQRSISFYRDLLGLPVHAIWNNGAYLSCGELWLCLSLDRSRQYISPQDSDYTHYAFTIEGEDFEVFARKLVEAGTIMWKQNTSEGESVYFLDPDGHKLEAHSGDLLQRLTICRESPYKGMQFFE
ncbi:MULTISPECIES: fosfomycin resistance glutathione transferase [Enterobacteriaceae]|uniref:fosfomycin resistance glutathione transferase n=1 Tax=Enterobacteriaceae TaxID=543 RepID=UPI00079C9FE0|nr:MULTISPECIES: fosfomycin resistance glutathione transferase [Enterobacteriaceae]CZX09537.1 glutathione transferase fosA [Enterobacter kobei]